MDIVAGGGEANDETNSWHEHSEVGKVRFICQVELLVFSTEGRFWKYRSKSSLYEE